MFGVITKTKRWHFFSCEEETWWNAIFVQKLERCSQNQEWGTESSGRIDWFLKNEQNLWQARGPKGTRAILVHFAISAMRRPQGFWACSVWCGENIDRVALANRDDVIEPKLVSYAVKKLKPRNNWSEHMQARSEAKVSKKEKKVIKHWSSARTLSRTYFRFGRRRAVTDNEYQ